MNKPTFSSFRYIERQAATAAALILLGLSAAATAADIPEPATSSGKRQSVAPAAVSPPRTTPSTGALYWYDGNRRRELIELPTGSAGPTVAGQSVGNKSNDKGSSIGVSAKQFVDRDGTTAKRSLAGGVIVTLLRAQARDQVDNLLASFGTRVVREIGNSGQVWLLAADAGMPSLTLANSIHESGLVRSAAPNWYKARVRK